MAEEKEKLQKLTKRFNELEAYTEELHEIFDRKYCQIEQKLNYVKEKILYNFNEKLNELGKQNNKLNNKIIALEKQNNKLNNKIIVLEKQNKIAQIEEKIPEISGQLHNVSCNQKDQNLCNVKHNVKKRRLK